MAHAVVRTNPKGIPFIGRCINCGKENLDTATMREGCPNTANRTQAESLMAAVRGDEDEQTKP